MRTLDLVALVLALVVAACSTTGSAIRETTPAYRLDAAQADAVILEAMRAGWPDKTPDPAEEGEVGYSFRVHWALDIDRVHARAVTGADGTVSFEVWNVGTAPIAGGPARSKLLELLQAAAERAEGAG